MVMEDHDEDSDQIQSLIQSFVSGDEDYYSGMMLVSPPRQSPHGYDDMQLTHSPMQALDGYDDMQPTHISSEAPTVPFEPQEQKFDAGNNASNRMMPQFRVPTVAAAYDGATGAVVFKPELYVPAASGEGSVGMEVQSLGDYSSILTPPPLTGLSGRNDNMKAGFHATDIPPLLFEPSFERPMQIGDYARVFAPAEPLTATNGGNDYSNSRSTDMASLLLDPGSGSGTARMGVQLGNYPTVLAPIPLSTVSCGNSFVTDMSSMLPDGGIGGSSAGMRMQLGNCPTLLSPTPLTAVNGGGNSMMMDMPPLVLDPNVLALGSSSSWGTALPQNDTILQPEKSQPAPVTPPQFQRTGIALQRERTGNLQLEEIAPWFHLPIVKAARRLSLCSTALKKVCRRHGLPRWPYRKVQSTSAAIERLLTRTRTSRSNRYKAAASSLSTSSSASSAGSSSRGEYDGLCDKVREEIERLQDLRAQACEGWEGRLRRCQVQIRQLEERLCGESGRQAEATRAAIVELNKTAAKCQRQWAAMRTKRPESI